MDQPTPDLQWDESRPAAECARMVLPKLAADFFREGRELVAASPSVEELHKLRLAVKRFRYTLELFRPCYGSGLEERLEALKRMQDHLGAMNDCETTIALLQEALSGVAGGDEFRQFLSARCGVEKENFLRHWRETFDSSGQEDWWVGYLARPESLGSGRALEPSEAETEPALRKTASG
jgi:CHAD domain-containing protein